MRLDKIMQLSGLIVEARRTNRYDLKAPAHFWWLELNGLTESSDGITKDISSSGVFVLTTMLPPVGARVELDVLLPAIGEDSTSARLHGEGFVVRLQHGLAGPVGFAASVQFYPETPDLAAVYSLRSSRNLLQ